MTEAIVEPTVVIVPGLRDHVANHWQTLLAARLARVVEVPRLGARTLSIGAWVEALESTVRKVEGPLFLAAHSAGVMMVAHWARLFRAPVAGALLATPPDLVTPMPASYPSLETLKQHGWMPVPRVPLPFQSLMVASRNDPLGRFEHVSDLGASWGSGVVDAGEVGHLNPASGFGEWPRALELLQLLGLPRRSITPPFASAQTQPAQWL